MAPLFEERTRDREPSGRFAPDLGEYNRTYVLHDPIGGGVLSHPITTQDLIDRINAVVGTTKAGPSPRALGSPGGAGSLDRTMPMTDPQFWNLFADAPAVSVVNLEGYTSDSTGGPATLAVPPAVPGFSRYNGYEFSIPFQARPYPIMPNERMYAYVEDFYDVDGTRKRLTYYKEWLRFCHRFTKPFDSRISATVNAAMEFYAPTVPDVHTKRPNAIPDMMVPDTEWRFRWYGVPQRYIDSANSFLLNLRGRINQNVLFGKPPGSLLYVGCETLKTYTPLRFVPHLIEDDSYGTFADEVLLDLDVIFIYTNRGPTYFPDGIAPSNPLDVPNVVRPNNNWIPNGHNLMPDFFTKRFYYAHAASGAADYDKWTPSYLSYALAALFQDPDVPGIIVSI
jgi:hypothetical protein